MTRVFFLTFFELIWTFIKTFELFLIYGVSQTELVFTVVVVL